MFVFLFLLAGKTWEVGRQFHLFCFASSQQKAIMFLLLSRSRVDFSRQASWPLLATVRAKVDERSDKTNFSHVCTDDTAERTEEETYGCVSANTSGKMWAARQQVHLVLPGDASVTTVGQAHENQSFNPKNWEMRRCRWRGMLQKCWFCCSFSQMFGAHGWNAVGQMGTPAY